jgi:tRNA G18 (ribose-2'-O)-methylase SpoU
MSNQKFFNPDFPDHIVANNGEDTRNIIDHYRYWNQEDIKKDLADKAYPLLVVAENFAHDFNISTLVRNSNGFNVSGVHIVGRKQWDKRGAVGTYHYTPIHHHANAQEFYEELVSRGVKIVVLDNIEGAIPLTSYEWEADRETAVIFGQESIGVSNLALSYASDVVEIPQRGSVRSLNVGTASGIVLYDYMKSVS